ncbi:uncharacterized protein LOC143225761 isoform X3 [Tachypleus tridentatus]|uniref:uncharacterized protein LOC143225761 isoform X3 n=1 Tax=Tachypleus tridentatus TaxID=6853 RepID=UPI003FD08A68
MRQISSGGTFSCTFDVFMNIHLKTFLIVTHVVLALYLYCSIIGTPGISSSPHAIHHFEDCEDIENFHVVNIDIASSRRRRPYNSYSTEERFLIGQYAAEHGNTKAATYYTRVLKKEIDESVARRFKKLYLKSISKKYS